MKILNKLTLKNLRLNKSRTIVTIIGILLSTALITVVAGIATSAQQTMINNQIISTGDWDMNIHDFESSDIKTIESNRDVKAVYIKDTLGCAYLPEAKNEKRPYININAFSKDALTECFSISLQEGRYPENDRELLLSQDIIGNSDKSYKVGDTITLEIGSRYDVDGNLLPNTAEYGTRFGESGEEDFVDDEPETLEVTQIKTYTIVGILNDDYNSPNVVAGKYTAACTAITCTDCKTLTDDSEMFVQFTSDAEKDYINTVAGIIGLEDDEVNTYLTHDADFFEELQTKSKYSFDINISLLQYKGYSNSDETMAMMYSLAGIILAIIIVASVFVIRNSFAISITEKTKLYGMIASVGATSKQIRKNVLFEGFILAAIGIPLGLLLGVGVAALLIVILNTLLGEWLNGLLFVYSIPAIAVVFAVLLSAVTILFSTISSAVRASRISPITAIRGNTDIKLSKKSKKIKKYKSPKFIKKLFGVGGDIAYKNLKRSKKKYRTTVISITVSVALFVAMSSFMEYGMKFTSEYYSEINYNLMIYTYSPEGKDVMENIKALDGAEDSALISRGYAYFNIDPDILTDEAKTSGEGYITDDGNYDIYLEVCAVDDDLYKSIVKNCGLDYDEVKNKGIFYNQFAYANDGKTAYAEFSNNINGYTLEGMTGNTDDINIKIEIAQSIKEPPKNFDELFDELAIPYGSIIVSEDWYENNIPDEIKEYHLFIKAEDADVLEEDINNLEYYDISVSNYDEMARQTNAIVLIFEIFIYGFILVITLIGVTNIFNTITTNMKLRSKEFATFKSVGMTKKEFNRMIRLESLFYGAKSLIIGIPLGILGSLGIFWAFTNRMEYNYVAPWMAIIISIVFVFAVVWLIMKFSVGKVIRQNIIETIRNDNI